MLWEIGDGSDLRALRNRLNLDSGYLSRLIGALQAEGLVETAPGADKRVREVRLTDGGTGRARDCWTGAATSWRPRCWRP